MVRPKEYFSSIPFNHMLVLNKHFNFKTTLKSNRKKFFKLKYGKRLFKTCILSTQEVFYGMYDPHITLPFKKSFFDQLWNAEYELIDATCKNKFRSKHDVSIWLVRYWQLLTGNFEPRSNKFGGFYAINNFAAQKNINKKIIKRKVICVNDTNDATLDFEKEYQMFENIMDNFLGEKSTFEK